MSGLPNIPGLVSCVQPQIDLCTSMYSYIPHCVHIWSLLRDNTGGLGEGRVEKGGLGEGKLGEGRVVKGVLGEGILRDGRVIKGVLEGGKLTEGRVVKGGP